MLQCLENTFDLLSVNRTLFDKTRGSRLIKPNHNRRRASIDPNWSWSSLHPPTTTCILWALGRCLCGFYDIQCLPSSRAGLKDTPLGREMLMGEALKALRCELRVESSMWIKSLPGRRLGKDWETWRRSFTSLSAGGHGWSIISIGCQWLKWTDCDCACSIYIHGRGAMQNAFVSARSIPSKSSQLVAINPCLD